MLIQDLGVAYLPSSMILFYLSAIIGVFKIFFVVHLMLRFLWAGLLGLSYAFPDGVIHEKLFSIGRGLRYQKPEQMALKMEKICSMTFAYPLSLVIIFMGITLILGLLLCVYIWVGVSFFYMYLLFFVSLIAFALFIILGKKGKIRGWYSTTIVSSVAAIYQSNLGKWFSLAYGIIIFGLATPIIYSDTRDFGLFFNESNLNARELEWPAKNLYYESHHDPEKRYGRLFLPSEEIAGDVLRLGLVRYEGDENVVRELKSNFKQQLDSMQWQPLDATVDLYRIYIDDTLVPVGFWKKQRLQTSGQKIFQSLIPIDSMDPGNHRIRVEKLMLRFDLISNRPGILLLEKWAVVDFYKM